MTMIPLLAYMDPGTGSMLLQLLVGGTAGLAVVGRHLWQSVVERLHRHPTKPSKHVSA